MKNTAALDMVDANVLLDFDSRYGYDETDQCLNSSATCRTANSMSSAFDISTMSHIGSSDTLYPSPLSSRRVTASPQPMSTDPPERSTDEAYASPSSVAASIATAKPTAKRKRENRYKNAAPSVLSRRRAQNRASQRAYRERKDQRIKDLELLLSEQKEKSESLGQAYANLHAEYSKLRAMQSRPRQPHPHQQIPMYGTPTMGGMASQSNMSYMPESNFVFQTMADFSL
ncbi:hypothetical protein HYQ44_006455 [Verticillium longisporum]|nr:hypothetical protein HYQ44_006455 [Verticillium longisporum]